MEKKARHPYGHSVLWALCAVGCKFNHITHSVTKLEPFFEKRKYQWNSRSRQYVQAATVVENVQLVGIDV